MASAMRANNLDPIRLLGDHLGSTSKLVNHDGSSRGEERYKAWGKTRFMSGDISTQYQFTGQYRQRYMFMLMNPMRSGNGR